MGAAHGPDRCSDQVFCIEGSLCEGDPLGSASSRFPFPCWANPKPSSSSSALSTASPVVAKVASRRREGAKTPEPERLESLTRELFRLHDLNGNGVLEEAELVRLNEEIAILHHGTDMDTEPVRSKYRDLFRSKLDPEGKPVPYQIFHKYAREVLNGLDTDPEAQEMILEQWAAEAQSGRQACSLPGTAEALLAPAPTPTPPSSPPHGEALAFLPCDGTGSPAVGGLVVEQRSVRRALPPRSEARPHTVMPPAQDDEDQSVAMSASPTTTTLAGATPSPFGGYEAVDERIAGGEEHDVTCLHLHGGCHSADERMEEKEHKVVHPPSCGGCGTTDEGAAEVAPEDNGAALPSLPDFAPFVMVAMPPSPCERTADEDRPPHRGGCDTAGERKAEFGEREGHVSPLPE
mmetsp:Transcript_88553/g.190110  ORF Transcript_88553/g.190110 Transcript_88553/m.190110 type:complete len:405 (+) Transcript_88553:77-1291(+)